MDKRYVTIFGPTGGIFGKLDTVYQRLDEVNRITEVKLSEDPNYIAPDLEIVEFSLVESGIIT